MKGRLALSFPYLCALFVVALMVWGQLGRDAVTHDMPVASDGPGAHKDPVCQMDVGGNIAAAWEGKAYFFCTDQCREMFLAAPASYLEDTCLVCRSEKVLTPVSATEGLQTLWQGKTYHFCSEDHRSAFRDDPAGYFMHTMWGIPTWLYYSGIAFVLIISFFIFERRAANEEGQVRDMGPRIDLLRLAWFRKLLIHPAARFVARALVTAVFVGVILAGLFGSQLPSKNIAPILTWTIWWGGLVLLILYAGKAWCYVCPWEAIADWSEGLRFWGVKKEGLSLGLRWPKLLRNIWPATVFFVALTWVEIGFGVTMNPRATAWLGLTMLGLAFVSAFIFDRKAFCRYGCLVGRVSGLYALFAPVEVRARDREICRSCATHSCFKGSEKGEPCPTSQFLAGMNENTYCISCMECVKTCEQGNAALRLRPWGEDLIAYNHPRSDEAYLALIMLSLTGFHGLTMTGAWQEVLGWIQTVLGLGATAAFTAGMAALMVAPGLIYAGLVALSRWMAKEQSVGYRDYFIRYAYALLPIALFYHVAHNSEHLLTEGQKVVALMSDPLGREWNLFGTADWVLAPLVNLPTLWIIQVLFVMIGHIYSLWIARRVAGNLFPDSRTVMRSQLPILAAMVLFSVLSLWLLKQPMEMRTSAM